MSPPIFALTPVVDPEIRLEQIARRTHGKMLKLDDELLTILTKAQLQVVDEFVPCLIPPRELADPVRAGQARDHHPGADEWLRIARTVPKAHAESAVKGLVDVAIRHISDGIEGAIEKIREKEMARLRKILLDARKLSDAEFELNRQELSASIFETARNIQKEIRNADEGRGPKRRISRAGSFLLNPRTALILTSKLENIAKVKDRPPAVTLTGKDSSSGTSSKVIVTLHRPSDPAVVVADP